MCRVGFPQNIETRRCKVRLCSFNWSTKCIYTKTVGPHALISVGGSSLGKDLILPMNLERGTFFSWVRRVCLFWFLLGQAKDRMYASLLENVHCGNPTPPNGMLWAGSTAVLPGSDDLYLGHWDDLLLCQPVNVLVNKNENKYFNHVSSYIHRKRSTWFIAWKK